MKMILALACVMAGLAGCFDDSGGNGNGTDTTTTTGNGNTTTPPPTPNEPPVLMLTITDDDGNETNTTLAGANLTFDPAGSMDPDGELTDLAVILDDGRTESRFAIFRTDGNQNQAKATFNFSRPGPVSVTLNGLDDRGERTELKTMVYINEHQDLGAFKMDLAVEDVPDADPCVSPTRGPDEANVAENAGWDGYSFQLGDNATYVVARVSSGQATIAICDPEGTALSPSADETSFVATDAGVVLVKPTGTDSYYVGALSGFVNQDVSIEVIVHYEPRPAEVTSFQ